MENECIEREYLYDNIKAFLIFCVVLGHMLEPFSGEGIKTIYIVIYSFHMPLFVFCSGMFAKFKPERIAKKIVLPYVIFQMINCLGSYGVEKDIGIQFTTPVWTLWYLPALFVWTMLVPFIDRARKRHKMIILCGAFVVGLLAGYDKTIGYYMSLSRIIVFLPYFILGFYYRQSDKVKGWLERIKSEYVFLTAIGVMLLICFVSDNVNPKWLYNSYTYADLNYNLVYRLFIYGCGMILSIAILKVFPKRKTCFSYIGQRSMQIFLLHGFMVRILTQNFKLWSLLNEAQIIAVAVLLSGVIVMGLAIDVSGLLKLRFKINIYGKRGTCKSKYPGV